MLAGVFALSPKAFSGFVAPGEAREGAVPHVDFWHAYHKRAPTVRLRSRRMPLVFPLRLHRPGDRVRAGHRRLSGQPPAAPSETDQPGAAFVRASGKCAECHAQQQHSIVHEYELSVHARQGINCLDCHQPAEGQEKTDHHGFVISTDRDGGQLPELPRDRVPAVPAQPARGPVVGRGLRREGVSPAEQVAFSEKFHPGAASVRRMRSSRWKARRPWPAAASSATASASPTPTAPSATAPPATRATPPRLRSPACRRPAASATWARTTRSWRSTTSPSTASCSPPRSTCSSSTRAPAKLTTRDMFIPTCATCHMSGLNGLKVTHDTSERLSYWLVAEVSEKRPNYAQAQAAMKEVCAQCHTSAGRRPRLRGGREGRREHQREGQGRQPTSWRACARTAY